MNSDNTGNPIMPLTTVDIKDGDFDNPTFTVIDKNTGEEADYVTLGWEAGLCGCDMEGFAITQGGVLILVDECGAYEYVNPDRFEIVWDKQNARSPLKTAYPPDPKQ